MTDIVIKAENLGKKYVIGHNGAGKSTLLKILSRITEPSSGRVTIKGRVASLLAVGDAQFQKKCLGKMGEVALQGRTVLHRPPARRLNPLLNICCYSYHYRNNHIPTQKWRSLQTPINPKTFSFLFSLW
jgi:energy-coupling factor transporter ATP-binding protein EcfA2